MPTNIFVPGVPSIGKSRRRVFLGSASSGPFTYLVKVQDTPVAPTANICLGGNYLYAANQNKKLLIYDIGANPGNPPLVGSLSDVTNLNGSGAVRVNAAGTYAFVSCEAGASMTVIDISNKTAPTFVARVQGPLPSTSLAGASNIRLNAAGTVAYVTTITRNSLAVIDISTPTAPVWLTEVRGPVAGTSMRGCRDVILSLDEKTAYVSMDTSNGIAVVDVTTPASATYVTTVSDAQSASCRGIVLNAAGTRLFQLGAGNASATPAWAGGITTWDISGANKNNPQKLAVWLGQDPFGGMRYIAGGRGIVLSTDEKYMFVTSESGDNLSLFDMSTDTAITYLTGTKGPVPGDSLDAAFPLYVKNGYAYIALYSGAASPSGRGFAVVQIDPKYNPP
jgi:hypothetical protein